MRRNGLTSRTFWTVAAPVLFLLTVRGSAQTVPERLRLVHADSLIGTVENGAVVQELRGHVDLIQGDARVRCQRAKWWRQENRAILLQSVEIFDGRRTLHADRVDYDGQAGEQTATGNVRIVSGSRLLSARRVQYFRDTEQAFAEGDVVVVDSAEHVTLSGDRGTYSKNLDYGKIEGRTHCIKTDTTSGEQLIVSASTLESWNGAKRIVATDSVEIVKADWRAACRTAEYLSDHEMLILRQTPVVWYRNQQMHGDSIDIKLDQIRFSGGLIRGGARIVSRDSTIQDQLDGQQIAFETQYTDVDTLLIITVDRQASSLYHVYDETEVDQGVNSVTGDQIVLTFRGDLLDNVLVRSDPGQCTGLFTPLEDEKRIARPLAPQSKPPSNQTGERVWKP